MMSKPYTQPDHIVDMHEMVTDTNQASEDKLRQHNELDGRLAAVLMQQHPEWAMETIREAALICSNTMLVEENTAFLKDTELARTLDKYGRDLAVSGLHHSGFSTDSQKILKQLQANLESLIRTEKLKLLAEVRERVIGEGDLVDAEILKKLYDKAYSNGYNDKGYENSYNSRDHRSAEDIAPIIAKIRGGYDKRLANLTKLEAEL